MSGTLGRRHDTLTVRRTLLLFIHETTVRGDSDGQWGRVLGLSVYLFGRLLSVHTQWRSVSSERSHPGL